MKYNFLLSILNLLDLSAEFFNGVFIQLDAPSPWGIYFQDSATPQFEGLIELHENIILILLILIIIIYSSLFLSGKLKFLHLVVIGNLIYSCILAIIYGQNHFNNSLLKPITPATLLNRTGGLSSLNNCRSSSFSTATGYNYLTKYNFIEGGQLNPGFITGFIDAEGSYMALFRHRAEGYNNVGWHIEAVFQVKLHRKDVKLLESLQSYFGVGKIVKSGEYASAFVVRSLKDITDKVLPHFDNYPLKTKKRADYLIWREIVMIMNNGDHLTKSGVQNIINLRASLNKGLTDTLKLNFPRAIPVTRPDVVHAPLNILSNSDCDWVAGFTSGEGSFKVKIKESLRSKVGFQTFLDFSITQHSRDEELLKTLINFFGCGQYKIRGGGSLPAGDFYCVNFTDITEKIIPFYKKHVIKGIKFKDFQDWCRVAELMENGIHKTPEGLELIGSIKSGMNASREWK